jgi:UDP-N-acetylmuramoylalanine--D-glutamate ligase
MVFNNKKILIVGMGKSGMGAALTLAEKNAQITICDKKQAGEIAFDIEQLVKAGIKVHTGGYPLINQEQFDLIVASPGIPLDILPFQQALAEGVPVIGELELAYQLKHKDTVIMAITGTNGKTTTTALLQKILENDGKISYAGGNIGTALTTLINQVNEGFLSVEVSSFQLETIVDFRPKICGIINITPDHLDRHKTMAAYIETKERITKNQTEQDFAVFNYNDPILREMASRCKAQVFYFSTEEVLKEGAYLDNNNVMISVDQKTEQICSLDDIQLRGKHNLENILCAALMAYLGGVKSQSIADTLKSFKGVRHRMEEVALENGILYINDSKATNPDSAIKALESFDKPIVLIAGGKNKGSSFDLFALYIKEKVKELVLVGEAKEDIKHAVIDIDYRNIHEVEDFSEAVIKAHKLARNGDVVLLSPACASWDMFPSYEHRQLKI